MTFAMKMSKACLLILGYLTIYSIAADTIHTCPPNFYGLMPYTHNCCLYVDCLHGYALVLQCPLNEVFHPVKMACVPATTYPECEDGGFIRITRKKK